jgi:hypothetical protein
VSFTDGGTAINLSDYVLQQGRPGTNRCNNKNKSAKLAVLVQIQIQEPSPGLIFQYL